MQNKLTKEECFKIAEEGAVWLSRCVMPDGKFIYGYNARTNEELQDYNVLRHAGCVWAMLEVANHLNLPSVREKGELALEYLIKHHINSDYYVYEDNCIKMGAMGLTILALLANHAPITNPRDENIAISIANTIIKNQNEDGSLKWHKYDMIYQKPNERFYSEFYDGECALALAKLGHFSNVLHEAAHKLIHSKYKKKQKNSSHCRDHWMMQAINTLMDNKLMDSDNDWYDLHDYSARVSYHTMIDSLKGVRIGAIACRSESLVAKILINNRGNILKSEGYNKLLEFLNIQKEGQIKYGLSTGAFRASPSSYEVRCDYTQHNIMSFLNYGRYIVPLLEDENKKVPPKEKTTKKLSDVTKKHNKNIATFQIDESKKGKNHHKRHIVIDRAKNNKFNDLWTLCGIEVFENEVTTDFKLTDVNCKSCINKRHFDTQLLY